MLLVVQTGVSGFLDGGGGGFGGCVRERVADGGGDVFVDGDVLYLGRLAGRTFRRVLLELRLREGQIGESADREESAGDGVLHLELLDEYQDAL